MDRNICHIIVWVDDGICNSTLKTTNYKFKENMNNKYKVGDKVRIRKNLKQNKFYGGRMVGVYEKHYLGMVAEVTRIGRNYYDLDVDGGFYYWTDEMLEPLEKTLDNLEVGDILVYEDGDECKVLGICGIVYHLSNYNDLETASGNHWTLEEIKEVFTLKGQPKKTIELSMDEIADKFGVDIKRLKIKKEK